MVINLSLLPQETIEKYDLIELARGVNCLKTRRSVGAYVFTYNGDAIAYCAKWIVIICTSSTEAEFVTAASAAKAAKYLRAILIELSTPHPYPTVVY
jgi:hypothetical protein